MLKPWLTGATCCWALTTGVSQCEPPFVIRVMMIMSTKAHGRVQRICARRHVNGLETFMLSSKLALVCGGSGGGRRRAHLQPHGAPRFTRSEPFAPVT